MSSRRSETTNNGTHQPYSQRSTMMYAPPSTELTETLHFRTRHGSNTNPDALRRARGRCERPPAGLCSYYQSTEPRRPPQARLSTSPCVPSDDQTSHRRGQVTERFSQPSGWGEEREFSTFGLTPAQVYRLATSSSGTRVQDNPTVTRPSRATPGRQTCHRSDNTSTATAPAKEFRRTQAALSTHNTQTASHGRRRSGKTNQGRDKRPLRDQYEDRRRNSHDSIELPNDPGDDPGNQEGQPPGEGGEECCDECGCDECCAEFGKCIMECFKGDCAFDCKD